ncbi:hypothetical protein [Pseudomonas sp. NPDC089569]|uniref:hypothetical protein n=1 Tax=Pseudomonas sp. NPDC089569 TaxID=3390722 RepID=UPI003D006517
MQPKKKPALMAGFFVPGIWLDLEVLTPPENSRNTQESFIAASPEPSLHRPPRLSLSPEVTKNWNVLVVIVLITKNQ